MAYEEKSNQFMSSTAPYPPNDTMNFGTPYQTQQPMPGPPPPPYYPSQPPLPNVVYTTPPPNAVYTPSPIVIQPVLGYLGHHPQPTQCPSCRQQIISSVVYEANVITWLIALIICFFGGIFGCCLIPFCIPGCQDAVHSCPVCHAPLARRNPF